MSLRLKALATTILAAAGVTVAGQPASAVTILRAGTPVPPGYVITRNLSFYGGCSYSHLHELAIRHAETRSAATTSG